MTRKPEETDLLVAFEIASFPTEYRKYYATKRNNLFATIQGYPALWQLYIQLDEILMRELSDLERPSAPYKMLPLLCCINCHAKIRVSLELAFSGCLSEARSILRDAIEFFAHAHVMQGDAALQKTWLNKVDGKKEEEAFKDAFERNKKKGLFKGLDELHKLWAELSETGSHANAVAMSERFNQSHSGNDVTFSLNYLGAGAKFWVTSIFSMLLTCSTIECTFFNDYNDRLKLDAGLLHKRTAFHAAKEQLRVSIIQTFDIAPPGGIYPVRATILAP